jgi:hypothetical protein
LRGGRLAPLILSADVNRIKTLGDSVCGQTVTNNMSWQDELTAHPF